MAVGVGAGREGDRALPVVGAGQADALAGQRPVVFGAAVGLSVHVQKHAAGNGGHLPGAG